MKEDTVPLSRFLSHGRTRMISFRRIAQCVPHRVKEYSAGNPSSTRLTGSQPASCRSPAVQFLTLPMRIKLSCRYFITATLLLSVTNDNVNIRYARYLISNPQIGFRPTGWAQPPGFHQNDAFPKGLYFQCSRKGKRQPFMYVWPTHWQIL